MNGRGGGVVYGEQVVGAGFRRHVVVIYHLLDVIKGFR